MLEFWIKRGDFDVNVKDKVIYFKLSITYVEYRGRELHCLMLLKVVALKLLAFY